MRIGFGKRLAFLAVILSMTAIVLEASFRIAAPALGVDTARLDRYQDYVWTGKSPYFEPRAYYSHVHRTGGPGVSALGFHSSDYPSAKPPGVVRIACLGGSTTDTVHGEGMESSYPLILESILRREFASEVQVMNWGMPGWTTNEILVNYFLNVQDTDPDIVILMEAVNDVPPRMWPGFRSDYCHYRRPWLARSFAAPLRWLLRLSDLCAFAFVRRAGDEDMLSFVTHPVDRQRLGNSLDPVTSVAFRRNARTVCEHVRLRGGSPVLVTLPYDAEVPFYEAHKKGIEEHNGILRELASENGWVLVDLAAAVREKWTERKDEFIDLVHVTKEGNRFKAARIARALSDAGLLVALKR